MADADSSELPVTPTFLSAPSHSDQPGAGSTADQKEETGGDPRADMPLADDRAPPLDGENKPGYKAPARHLTSHLDVELVRVVYSLDAHVSELGAKTEKFLQVASQLNKSQDMRYSTD